MTWVDKLPEKVHLLPELRKASALQVPVQRNDGSDDGLVLCGHHRGYMSIALREGGSEHVHIGWDHSTREGAVSALLRRESEARFS